jgi:hypothetical protein
MKKKLTLNNPHTRFNLSGDRDMFHRIAADMIKNGGELAPSNHWNWNLGHGSNKDMKLSGYTDELFIEKYSQLEMMLNPWIGVTGMKSISADVVAKYERFLRDIDHLGLLPDDVLSHGLANDWRETDLGSVMDTNLISAFFHGHPSRKITICEVGGGYGRLAEVLIGVLSGSVHYVLVDAVPGSLMYAYMYLKRQLPHLKIGSYYQGDSYSNEYDCYIMPAWQVQQLPEAAFDICINIESMQEMEQYHVDYYLALFDRLLVVKGLIYLSNARDYVFSGEWNIPDNWEVLFFNNTPRSWTADHPTQVFRKRSGNFSKMRLIFEGLFNQQIAAWKDRQLINQLKLHIVDRDRICNELKLEISRLTVQIENSHGQKARIVE